MTSNFTNSVGIDVNLITTLERRASVTVEFDHEHPPQIGLWRLPISNTLRLIVPGFLVIALAGCTSPSGTDDAPDGAPAAGGTVAECVQGHTWDADVADMAAQLLVQLQSNGSPATSTTGVGTQTLSWGMDGAVVLDTDYTFTVVAPLSDGLIMTMNQTHAGPTTGTLALDGNIATPTDWDRSGYLVTTVIDINGTATEMEFPIPEDGLGDVALEVTCEGNAMTTFAPAGFVTTKWTRTD